MHQEDNDMSLKNLTGKHLNLEDREYIQAALERGILLSDMADRLNNNLKGDQTESCNWDL